MSESSFAEEHSLMGISFEKVKEKLERGLERLEIDLPKGAVTNLLHYLQLLVKWNKSYNLSAVRDPLDMVSLHLLDSLAVVPHLSAKRILDVGTGAGLPGIPLSIVFPERTFTLLDSAGKKTRFLVHVKQNLSLNNVQVENCRVEAFTTEEKFDGIISRAFASLSDMTEQCHHLLRNDGAFWAMKGQSPKDELRQIAKHYRVEQEFQLNVPGLNAHRCLLKIVPDSGSGV